MNTITLQDIINTYYQRTFMQNDLQNIIWPENILMYRIIFRNSFSYQMMDRFILYKSIKEIIPSPWYSVCIKRIPFLHKKVRTLSHKLDLRWQATHFLHGKYFILTKSSHCVWIPELEIFHFLLHRLPGCCFCLNQSFFTVLFSSTRIYILNKDFILMHIQSLLRFIL